jgi:hypothetical protein
MNNFPQHTSPKFGFWRGFSVAALAAVGMALAFAGLTGTQAATDPLIYGVDTQNRLITFHATPPTTSVMARNIRGLAPGEQIVGIDVRPANGMLYGISSNHRVYTLSPTTGMATAVGNAPLSPMLSGNHYGLDFNPTVDRIRAHGDDGQNLRLHPDTGAVVDGNANEAGIQGDGRLVYAANDPNAGRSLEIVASAYTENVAGAKTTALFALDAAQDALVMVTAPNTGQTSTVRALGFNLSSATGFDIAADGTAYVVTSMPNERRPVLYTINLGNGELKEIGKVGWATPMVGIAVMLK